MGELTGSGQGLDRAVALRSYRRSSTRPNWLPPARPAPFEPVQDQVVGVGLVRRPSAPARPAVMLRSSASSRARVSTRSIGRWSGSGKRSDAATVVVAEDLDLAGRRQDDGVAGLLAQHDGLGEAAIVVASVGRIEVVRGQRAGRSGSAAARPRSRPPRRPRAAARAGGKPEPCRRSQPAPRPSATSPAPTRIVQAGQHQHQEARLVERRLRERMTMPAIGQQQPEQEEGRRSPPTLPTIGGREHRRLSRRVGLEERAIHRAPLPHACGRRGVAGGEGSG